MSRLSQFSNLRDTKREILEYHFCVLGAVVKMTVIIEKSLVGSYR